MRKIYLLLSLFAVAMVTAVKSYSQINVTSSIGAPASYTTLNAAVNAINAGTHGGLILVSVAASTIEPAASVLNASGVGAANYTYILIKPAPATTPTITGNIPGPILQLVGADNVSVDGSNAIGGTTQDLTVSNTNTGGTSVVFWISSASAANGATNDTIRNCKITGFSSSTTVAGVLTGDNITPGNAALAANSNNVIVNNLFTNTQNAIYLFGVAAGGDANWIIGGNTMTTLGFRGMIASNISNATIAYNTITGVIGSAPFLSGIQVGTTVTNCNIYGNIISNINNTAASSGSNGIALMGTTGTNNNIYNNFVSEVWSTNGNPAGTTFFDNGYGILIAPNPSGASYKLFYNTVRMVTPQTSGQLSTPINIQSGMPAGSVVLQDNIFDNEQPSGAVFRPAIYSNATTSALFGGIDYNDYYAASGTLGYINSTPCPTLATIQANFGSNVNSITYLPIFATAPPDLHLSTTVFANFSTLRTGTPITVPPVTDDIDLSVRSTTTPTMGAHELQLHDTIVYTPLVNTCSNGNVTLNPVSILAPLGVPTAGALKPRIYFKKNAGPWFSQPGTLVSGTATLGDWSFVIPAAAMGGVIGGDVISYYIIAQDNAATPVVFAYPNVGLVAANVNSVATPPTTPLTYTVDAVSLTSLTSPSVCFNSVAATPAPITFSGAPGAPNEYTLTWTPSGPTDVTVFTPFSTSPITANVPASTPVGTYTGILNIRNTTSTCVNTYTVSLTVNPLPNPIAGNQITCIGLSTILTSTTPGGTWTSASPGVATVGVTSGVVTGVTANTAVISYTLLTGCYATAIVTVNTPPAAITPASPVICQTATTTLSNSVSGGTWGSLNTSVAIVDAVGVVTGVTGGTATITYATPGCNAASRVVTVNPLPALITGSLAICRGFTSTLSSATAGGTWKSNNHAVDTVGLTTGVVIAVAPGTALVSYTLPTGCARVVTTTVNSNPSAITPSGPVYVCQGLTTTLTNTTPGGTWLSQFPGAATVTSFTGAVTGVTAGSATLISYVVTATGCYATKSVTVTAPPSAISGPNVFCANTTATLLNLTPGGTWTTSNAAVATVGPISPVQGAVTGASNVGGTAVISYTTLACNPVTHPVTLTLSPSIITGPTNVCIGTMTALGNTVPGGTWSSSNPAVGSVSPGGVVTGLTAGGTVTITYALSNGCYTVAPIVVDAPPAPIGGPDTLCPMSVGTFTTASTGGLWSSSSGAIATVIAATGDVTAVSAGSVNVSYSFVSGCYTTKPLFVRTPIPTTVTMATYPNIDTVHLCAGSPLGFKAHSTNGGPGVWYEWTNHVTTVLAAGVSDTFAYIPTHGDYIKVKVHPDSALCATPDSAVVSVNVLPVTTPSITISTATNILTYLGQIFTFTSSVTNGGSAPTYQWFQNGLLITGATNSSYSTPLYAAASFLCTVTGNAECAASNNASSNNIYIYKQIVGVQSLATNNDLSMTPNPNTGSFVLTGITTEKELDLEITNMLGQVVFRGKTSPQNGVINEPVALKNDIAAGTYILRVHSEATNDIFHFVVNK